MADGAPGSEPATARLPYGFARRRGAMLVARDGAAVCLHRPDATPETLIEAQRLCGGRVAFERLDVEAFESALAAQYRDSASAVAEVAAAADGGLAALADSAATVDDLLDQRDDAPVVRLINALLLQAVKDGASDIHVETQESRVAVRFRIDGMLREVLTPKRALAPLLVSRLKVMARLDIAEKRLPQDGRVSLRVGGHEIDVRVSTIPSQHGERVVLRLLDRHAVRLDLDAIGMTARDHELFARMLRRPNGVLLVTGPTGSGKTTSLYAALSHLNDRVRNIMTVEDPIEYALEGVAQTQTDTKTGLTFARGLRAILRQDPDVIMVGEIRDAETARVALQASMTGHLVLSTLHTNTAVGSVTRLIDMGVERFLLAPMLVGLVAQRLVRTLCPGCRREDSAAEADAALLARAVSPGAPVWRPVGCPSCHGQGYRGRTGLYEVVAVDDEMEALITAAAPEAELVAAARRAGPSLLADGAAKVMSGVTSVEEVARVVQEE